MIEKDKAIEELGEDGVYAAYCGRLLSDSRCTEVVVKDLRGISQVVDFLIIATGQSDRQMNSMATEIKLLAKDQNQHVYNVHEGSEIAWTVIDCVTTVIHLMDEEQRAYYDLDSMWSDGKSVLWADYSEPGQFNYLTTGSNSLGTV